MSGLLRKPGSFEGLLGIEIGPKQECLAILDLGHERQGRVGLDAACLTPCAGAADRDESVSQIPDLRHLDVDLAEGLVEVSEHLADSVVSSKHSLFPSQQGVQRRVPLHLGIELLQQRFDVSAVARLESALESLDVLLRHRQRSIPQAQESA